MSANDASDLPSLPSDVAELVASARRIEGPTGDVRDRLRARLVAGPPPPGGGGEMASAVSPKTAAWARAPWWAVAAAFAGGIGAGRLTNPSTVANGASVASESGVVLMSAPPSAAPSSGGGGAITVASLPEAPPPSTIASVAPAVPTKGTASSRRDEAGDLAIERRLLAVARTALGRENGSDALAACDDHARRFPNGVLAEEREAIAVQALVQSKRSAEAQRRGARFRQSYPKSILLPAVLAALEVEP